MPLPTIWLIIVVLNSEVIVLYVVTDPVVARYGERFTEYISN